MSVRTSGQGTWQPSALAQLILRRLGFCLVLTVSGWLIARHAWYLLLAARDGGLVVGNWLMVLLHTGLFSSFLLFLGWRREVDWKSKGIFFAFILAMFFEMYGIPLSAYLLLALLHNAPSYSRWDPLIVIRFSFLGQPLFMTLPMIVGTLVTTLGGIFVVLGWLTLWRSRRRDPWLATNGLYRISRHPQYLGFILISLGWMIHWPTLPTILLGPVVIWRFWSLARREERELLAQCGDRWIEYSRRVAAWF